MEVVWDDITAEKELQLGSGLSFVVTQLGYAESGPRGVTPEYTGEDLGQIYVDLALIVDEVPFVSGLVGVAEDRDVTYGGAPDGGDLISITPPSSHASVIMTSTDSPKRWYEIYGLAGMTINRVSYDGNNWTYEGRIYAKQ
jgi:hypothetical protein